VAEATARLSTALAGRYRLERELGQGGMATVYLAADLKHDRKVAIKVLRPELAAVLGAERFVQEIKTTAALQHPHILPLLDSGDADGSLYYVMPYVAGETLRARLERERQLPIDDALRIAREVADALGAAHAQGIVHRDIKPENILLQAGHALVADFGIALAVQTAAGDRMTQTGLSLGTPQYMSPEQAMGEKQIDARADIYALGAVTYEMLTGDPPFTGASVQAVVAKVISAEPERPTLVRKTIPPHVEAVVLRALAKLAADRFATAADFSAALSTPSMVYATASASATTAGAGLRSGVAGRRRAVVAAGVLLVAGGLAGGWLLGRSGRAPGHAEAALSTSVLLPDSLQLAPELLMPEGTETLALSPDGRQLVFAARHGDASQLYLRTLSRFDLRPLDGTAGAQAPFFSPSADMVYFFGPRGLMRVTLADGRVTLVRRRPPNQFQDEAWGGTVMADGRVVLSQGYTTYLIVLTPAGDSVRTIACTTTCGFPKALPDGRHVLFGNGAALWVVDLETGTSKAVMQPAASGGEEMLHAVAGEADGNGHLVYATLDGRLHAAPFDAAAFRVTGPAVAIADSVRLETGRGGAQFAVSPSGVLVYAPGDVAAVGILVRADRSGKIDAIPAPPDDYDGLALSPDGRRLAVHVRTAGGDRIQVIDVATGHVSPWLADRTLGFPSWTAGGRQIAYAHGDTGLVGDPDQNTAPRPLPPGTAVGRRVFALSDSGAYLALFGDSVRVLRGGQRIGSAVAGSPWTIYTPTGDGRWLIQTHLSGEGSVEALAIDGSARRVVIASQEFNSFTTVAGGTGLIGVTDVARSVDGRAETEETFYSMSYDPSSTSPFGSPRKLFSATVADFPGRNYTVGMGGNRFVFKRHVASPPLREVRVMTSWSAMLRPGAER
jgi:tRNA A-37 threonylcarbamoyl transferase component Bud32/Tol biopolymer transport system component